jgi:hypothetical protein
MITVTDTIKSLEARLGALPAERMAAATRALNRTMTTVRAEAARKMRDEYPGVKIGTLRRRMKLTKATRLKPSAAIVFSGRRFSLYRNFSMRRVGQFGVRFRKLPWRIETIDGDPVTPEMIARAFVQRGRRSGAASVFSRHTRERDSFEVLVAPGVARAFAERKIGEALSRIALARFSVVFQHELKFRISKR